MNAQRNRGSKPHVKIAWRSCLNGQVMWECETGSMTSDWLIGYGASPKSAYHSWRIEWRRQQDERRNTPIRGAWL